MEEFFYIGCQIDEVKLMDLILRRYHSFECMDILSVEKFCELIILALEQEKRAEYRAEWLVLLPSMISQGKYMSFDDYYDTVTGKNIDMRPAEEIIAEIDKLHAEAGMEK